MSKWDDEGYGKIDVPLLEGEIIEDMYVEGDSLFVATSLDRIFQAINYKTSPRHWDLVEVTDFEKEEKKEEDDE